MYCTGVSASLLCCCRRYSLVCTFCQCKHKGSVVLLVFLVLDSSTVDLVFSQHQLQHIPTAVRRQLSSRKPQHQDDWRRLRSVCKGCSQLYQQTKSDANDNYQAKSGLAGRHCSCCMLHASYCKQASGVTALSAAAI